MEEASNAPAKDDIMADLRSLQVEANDQAVLDDEIVTLDTSTITTAPDPAPIVETTLTMATEERERSSSPSLALSPTFALDACPQLDRSVSTASSRSRRSSSSQLSDSGLSGRRRGYMRPQATTYAESAKNRDSVMSLGTIAHLQYYFARTGLLDGKGAQFAKENAQKRKSSSTSSSRVSSLGVLEQPNGFLSVSPGDSYAVSESGLTESPVDGEDGLNWDQDPLMLPPTFSTYNHRPIYVQPPPDVKMLRRELTEALEDALKVLKESDKSPDSM
jgi:hypothetical protein